MITISRTFTAAAAPDPVLAYLRDLANADEWDPAARRTVRTGAGPLAVGATWHKESRILGVTTELTYTLVAADAETLVFAGRNEGATSTEALRVRPAAGGSEVSFHVELELHGLAKLATPILRAEFEKLGTRTAARLAAVLGRLAPA
ncbi:hypothetical protein Asp14428_28190 [Actinoplanes sp. NBRC 14428]|uniref:Polyketide cyclase/dehydrase/lipid transport protein n=1 Tax=Pseudosporangium ferrugineum TaxID=439699 RepID=A0A2T0RH82_9ACTN|nr:SRPBCC family protein [Pseudosporangium ferrugineum]PRY20533.1 polyketide cyclase/dehydrase/lipid transport protein [Pseudosporangium ferrugineum]BCJ51344.1 hypothetical protein Asp14428_28190 [Actinoplanes sp. NBRC 14428]